MGGPAGRAQPLPRRPRVHPLTARALRRAHALAEDARKLGADLDPGVALLASDYWAWRARVARGLQADTPPPPRGRVVLP